MKKERPIVILCPLAVDDAPIAHAAYRPWESVSGVTWFWGLDVRGERFGGGCSRLSGAESLSPGAIVIYDLDQFCGARDPMQREVWVRNLLRTRALEMYPEAIPLSVDADEVCLNSQSLASEIRARPGVARWARWRTIVHDDGAYAVGPWDVSAPNDPVLPGWSQHAGFQLSTISEFAGNGRASSDLKRRSCGMFLHRSWDAGRAREKLRSWSHSHHAVDVEIFAVQLEALERCRGDLPRLMGVAQGLCNWGPYPGARWPGAAIWRSEDLEKLNAEPIWRTSENNETKGTK